MDLDHEFSGQRLFGDVVEAGLIAFFFCEVVLESRASYQDWFDFIKWYFVFDGVHLGELTALIIIDFLWRALILNMVLTQLNLVEFSINLNNLFTGLVPIQNGHFKV